MSEWMDAEGYPNDAALERIRKWDWRDFSGLMNFMRSLWWSPQYLFKQKGPATWDVSTGGWSGNEEMIKAMSQNGPVWSFFWLASYRGGHYTFAARALGVGMDDVNRE
jgi:hypothetical protein